MTIAIAWLRRIGGTVELLLASDSRLRSFGAMDQAQKLFRLHRGDCALAFCGDAQVAYPFFIQVATTLDNHIKTRTRAADLTQLISIAGQLLNQLIGAWDILLQDKTRELSGTRILFGGWSPELQRFEVGFFKFDQGTFRFHHKRARTIHPWHESKRSLVFLGDYEADYMDTLRDVLELRHGRPEQRNNDKIVVDFDYEPVEALYKLLDQRKPEHTAIGGSQQVVKIYRFGNTLPFVVRKAGGHYLLGRRLFDWEKTEYPVFDMAQDPPVILYPLEQIPLPDQL